MVFYFIKTLLEAQLEAYVNSSSIQKAGARGSRNVGYRVRLCFKNARKKEKNQVGEREGEREFLK